jgi:hypothetical protein
MNVDYIKQALNRGEEFAFDLPAEDNATFGWVIVSARKPVEPSGPDLTPTRTAQFERESRLAVSLPYKVVVMQVSRNAYQSKAYLTHRQYIEQEAQRFASLTGVAEFVAEYDLKLEDAKPRASINAPDPI